jgi:hypothetical protein
MTPVTPQMILAERQMKSQLGTLAHTLNTDGRGTLWVDCTCYTCRDFYDPTGEQDAALRNALAQPNGGAVLPMVEPLRLQLPRADGVRPEDSPLVRACRDAGLPLPPPPPVLERQNAVILGRAPEPPQLRAPPMDDVRILEQMLVRWREEARVNQERLAILGNPANNEPSAQIAHLEARLNLLKAEQKVEKLNQLILSMRPHI